ncbi:family 10 glycosylhydrolase [Microcoleus sp. FACHB-1515]|uniref:family 10 glycosylhydrolase n=1 Tax=Cyanophyceae TaxID=3028117 RepID=UPI001682697B|nr:family 10 glycosylhydrolase [Microcoleus sp. FACHB-1515]MBD2089796.1 family 10 glycosylhydrolase [Microcoleus sp. FACHB-1515]
MSVFSHRHSIARLGYLLIVTLLAPAIALPVAATSPPVIQGVRQAPVVLGVVRSADNAALWPNISARLQGSEYRVIDWDQVRSPQDLASVTVLFLPSVETINSAQLLALEAWMGQGGRVIVTGAIGTQSSYGVQQALRSILGAYWQQPIEQPTVLTLPRRRTELWVQQGDTRSAIVGGVLGQSGVASESIATWGSANQAAIVVTGRSVFLGWEWGETSSEFDRTWFRAAIGRYGSLQAGRAIEPTPTAPTAAIAQPVQPTPAQPTQDPAEQVAPAQMQVQPSGQPISAAEAIAMQQELASLIGRFESALLAGASAESAIDLAATEEKSPDANVTPVGHSALTQAREILANFPQLVRDRNYSTARQQWILARRTLWDNFPTDRLIAQPEIRAIWLDRGTIVEAGSPEGLAQVFDRLAAAGINTVFFETINAGYPIYPSQIAPQQNPLVRGWDPLAAAVELAHARNMELHAWVWTFAAGNQLHNRLVSQPSSYPGPILAAHPDWANYDNAGNMIPAGQTKPFLDPANPQARQYLLNLFEEIVTRYNVDGLQLDYIRYPFQDLSANRTYGYGIAARQQFQQLTGTDPIALTPRSPLWSRWTQFRIEQVNSFVAQTAQLLRSRSAPGTVSRRSNLILSTAVFPLPTSDRLNRIQQNWELWAQRGDVDLIVPMSYAMDTNGLLRLASPWLTRADVGSALVLPSIRLLNLPEATAIDQIQALRDLPAGGYSLFAAENLSAGLQIVFDRTQGQAASPIPYRQPFQAAALRYAALTREWSYLLGQNQLVISPDQQQVWRSQAAALGEALDQLAADPSEANLDLAQSRLRRFQIAFPGWMPTSDSYRVRTWQNRLGAIADLLAYGDRRREE